MNEARIEFLLEAVFTELDNFERALRRKKAIDFAPINKELKIRLIHKMAHELQGITTRLTALDKEFSKEEAEGGA